MLKKTIQQTLAQNIKELFSLEIAPELIQVDFPTDPAHGDYTTNVAMTVLKSLPKEHKQSPVSIAENIAKKLEEKDNHNNFEKIAVAPPGFINITLKLSHLHTFIKTPLENQLQSFQAENKDERTILVEFVSPNTNKPLHIGHLRNACIGQALVNSLKVSGQSVLSGIINNDRGIHIIKSMYGFLMYGRKDNQYPVVPLPHYKIALEEWSNHPEYWITPQGQSMKSDHFVGYYYILGNTDYETAEKRAQEVKEESPTDPHNQMQQMLIDWENNEAQIRKLWQQNNAWYYEGLKETFQNFGITSPNDHTRFFDKEWYESNIYKEGKEIVAQHIGNGVITEYEDGHVEASLEKYHLPNIVLLRKNKTSLYITQDIELMRKRIKEDQVYKVVILTGHEQNLRFQQLFAVCDALEIASLDQMHHLGYGMVRLPEGKMSSRKGNVILIDELIAEVEEKAMEKINTDHAEYSQEEKEKISRQVAIAAIKYGILKYNALSNIVFDIESSISFEGDTGPYIQYTYARAASIIRKYKDAHPFNTNHATESSEITSFAEQEQELIRHLYKFPETIVKATQGYSPNYICEYLFILAQKFNLFYATSSIMNEKNSITQADRVQITQKSQEVIKTGLSLLGIEAPEKM